MKAVRVLLRAVHMKYRLDADERGLWMCSNAIVDLGLLCRFKFWHNPFFETPKEHAEA